MMPKTQLTEIFESLTESVQDTTQVSFVLSLAINLVMSGPLDALWSLINSLQIVVHFALINVMMPTNAYNLFQMVF